MEIIYIFIIGIVIGIGVDALLFRIWHSSAHSKKLKQKERVQKEKEEDDAWEAKHEKL